MKLNTGIPEKNRKPLIAALSQLLADEVALYIATRGAHWNVTGANFGALHSFFEDQYETLDDILDDVAERMRALGAKAPSTVGAYAKSKSIDDDAGAATSAQQMIESLMIAHEAIIRNLRKYEEIADDADDVGSEDFFVSLIEQHEKMAWMLRAHLE
jgi:starvation-inducible DNA-binding protein